MRILFVTTEVPSPQMGGGLIANYFHLRGLIDRGHEVVLASYVPNDEEAPRVEVEGLRQSRLLPGVPPTTWRQLLANLFQKEPIPIRKYRSVDVTPEILDLVEEHDFDLVHLASLHTAHLLEPLRQTARCPVVLFEQNVQAKVHELFFKMQGDPARRYYAWLQWKKMLAYEGEVCRRFDLVLTFSQTDADALADLSNGCRVSWMPLAVDVLRLSQISQPEDIDLLWIGMLRWRPNVDSLRWFCEEILPRILNVRPETTVAIAGSSPPSWVKDLARQGGVRVLGEVEDAHAVMARSRVILVPLRIGSGVRVKIIEALGLRRAVLSTTIGCEGIEVDPGRHLIVADDPEDFARQAVVLLEADGRRRELGAAGQQLALARHDFRQVGAEMSAVYEALVDQHRRQA